MYDQDQDDSPRLQLRTSRWQVDPVFAAVAAWVRDGGAVLDEIDEVPRRRRRQGLKRSRDVALAQARADALLAGWSKLIYSRDPEERARVTRLAHALYGHKRRAARLQFPEPYFTIGTIAKMADVEAELVRAILDDPLIGVLGGGNHVVLAPGVMKVSREPAWLTPPRIHHGTQYAYKRRKCRCDDCRAWNREARRAERRRVS